ncbi:MAG: HpcH/HpaI aldolase/citrate lyase family protein [Solirubrobacterales bacterium]
MRARRSCLSVPGSSGKMLAKAGGLAADEIVVDLEDSVVPGAKEQARELVREHLAKDRPPGTVAVRVNGLHTPWGRNDLVELGGLAIDTVVVPKVESSEDVQAVDLILGNRRAHMGIQALIETAAGLQRVGDIAAASPRLEALIVGYEDLAASLGRAAAGEDPAGWLYAQEAVLVAARAHGLQAIDGPYLALGDEPGLERWAGHARDLGYDGKWAIHPDQIEAINAAFTPSDAELEKASAVLAALEEAQEGAVDLGGAMIDEASRKQAEQVLARGRAADGAAR